MQEIFDFLSTNWEGSGGIAAVVLWIAVRVIPTKRNYDVFEIVVKAIGELIKNRRVDSLGNSKEKKP